MGYIGPRNSDQFKSMATQTITGNGSATSFSLNQAVANSSEVRFVVNNVVQKPDVDYTATGTTLGTGSNVLAGSDEVHNALANLDVTTINGVNPANSAQAGFVIAMAVAL